MSEIPGKIMVEQIAQIAIELKLSHRQVQAVVNLLDEDATVPFIARYRKEATGSLDEVAVISIRDRIVQLRELDKRRQAILKSLEERNLLTDELKEKILVAGTMAELEDIYLPFRPKRRTRATIAKEKGLEPLAEILFLQEDIDINSEASKYIAPEKDVTTAEEALDGARDIIAEWISEDSSARSRMRELFAAEGMLKSKVATGKETEAAKFRDYFDWQEPIRSIQSHRFLAIMRGEKEELLSFHIFPAEEKALSILENLFVDGDFDSSRQVRMAVDDSYKRLLGPSMETEIRQETKQSADAEAIRVFAENLRQLLLSPPLGPKRILAIDPGFRTGCKVVCLDQQGKLTHNTTVFPHEPEARSTEAAMEIKNLCEKFKIAVIAIGNGTAGRETELFIRNLDLPRKPMVVMVNESGASVYSASDAARAEFPNHDLTVRGAVSIGRRLMDPLSELVKIDPKSIGVGQYQHDVDQAALRNALEDVVSSCVNSVGVELNTASQELLTYVSGLGPHLARKIVEYREAHGPYTSREDLMEISGFGPKAFEFAAGFLRIRDAVNPLDASAVHPESYSIVQAMARDLKCEVIDLMKDEDLRKRINLKKYITENVGLPTLEDILAELSRPGRDPRNQFEPFAFSDRAQKIEDLKPGMKLPGIITNVTDFGAFVDIGVHQDGLVHRSQLADKFVKNPHDVVRVNQKVMVTVLEVDLERHRISLSLKEKPSIKPNSD